MTDRTQRILFGAVAAAAVAVVTYLAGQGVLTIELAAALNAIIAGVGGYLVPKTG
jgi:hypothetical protein